MYGKWVVKEVATFDIDTGFKMVPAAEVIASDDPALEDYKDMAGAVLVFSEDGSANTYVSLPAEQLEAAKAEGAPVTEYGILVDEREIKVIDGEFYYNSGEKGSDDADSFFKLELDEEGCFTLMSVFRFTKAD